MVPQHNSDLNQKLLLSEYQDTIKELKIYRRNCDLYTKKMENNSLLPVVFGSQRIDKNSVTPYSDATQVNFIISYNILKLLSRHLVINKLPLSLLEPRPIMFNIYYFITMHE